MTDDSQIKLDLTKELLTELYVNKKLSIKKLKIATGRSANCIKKAIRDFQLEKVLTFEDKVKQKGEITITKQEMIDLYIEQKMSIEDISSIYKCSKNKITNLVKLYELPFRDREEVFGLIHERSRQSMLTKYGVEHPYQIESVRDKMIEKVHAAFATGIPQQKLKAAWADGTVAKKVQQSKSLNRTHNTSQPEEEAYALLIEKFGEADVIRQYRSELYPYSCDFYVKSIDTYIEYQGSWTHGRRPYDPTNPTHQRLVKHWQDKDTEYFSYAVKIWTQRDPEKRRIAKENNLNWLEFWTVEEVENWLTHTSSS